LLVIKRDLGVAYVALAGVVCGIVSAIIAAPIAAGVFGGVTGSGTAFLVAAFQQAGSDLLKAVLQQGLLSDPIGSGRVLLQGTPKASSPSQPGPC
jgi:energy-coupling factor transport system substrate-specific component